MFRILQLTLLISISTFLSAQVVEKQMQMSAGEMTGLEVDLPVDSKTAEKLWKQYIKPYGKTDWDRKNREHVLFDVSVPTITSGALTIVAKFNQYNNSTTGSFWFKSSDGFVSASSDPESTRNAGEFLQRFAYETERHAIRGELNMQDKGLRSLDKQLEKLQKKNKNLHKDIEKAKAEIAKKEREIEENLVQQEEKKLAIDSQKEKIQQTTIKLSEVGKSTKTEK